MSTQKQQTEFKWSKATEGKVKRIIAKYPKDQTRSAVIPVLKLAQDEFDGWLDVPAMNLVAETLSLPYMRVYEVATFYTMFNLKPVGKFHVQVCTNCSCMIRGGENILEAVETEAGTQKGGTSKDDMFTISEVECLGACVDAPMMQINNSYYTKLDVDKARDILVNLRAGKDVETDTPAKPLATGY